MYAVGGAQCAATSSLSLMKSRLKAVRQRTNEVEDEIQAFQSILTISSGFEMPLTATSRDSEVGTPPGTVARLATISSGPARAAIREAS